MKISVLPVGLPDRALSRLEADDRIHLLSTTSRDTADALLYWLPDRHRGVELMNTLGERLRWVHVPWVGVERLMTDRVLSGDIVLTNSRGAAGSSVAEFVIGSILGISKDLPRHIRDNVARCLAFAPTREIRGQSLLIVGLGDIGKSVAR